MPCRDCSWIFHITITNLLLSSRLLVWNEENTPTTVHTMNSLSSLLASLWLTKLTFEWYTYLANTISWPISYLRTNQRGSKAQTSTPNSMPSQPRDLPEVPWSLATLITWCSYYISSSLAPSTCLVYTSALKSYHCFCQAHDFPLKPTTDSLSFFLTYCSLHL